MGEKDSKPWGHEEAEEKQCNSHVFATAGIQRFVTAIGHILNRQSCVYYSHHGTRTLKRPCTSGMRM